MGDHRLYLHVPHLQHASVALVSVIHSKPQNDEYTQAELSRDVDIDQGINSQSPDIGIFLVNLRKPSGKEND